MTNQQHFVAWQPVLTDHQAYTWHELSRQSGRKLVAYVLQLEDPLRRKQGWSDTRVDSVERRLLPSAGTLRHCYRLLIEHRNDIHLFASPFDRVKLMLVLLMAVLLRIDFYLISEPYSPRHEGYFGDATALKNRMKSMLRPWVYRIYGRIVRRRVSGVFAISSLAATQYQRVGVDTRKLFPFGYFVPKVKTLFSSQDLRKRTSPNLALVFVGSLIQRKGLDLLIIAVKRLQAEGHTVSLDIFGPGDPSALPTDMNAIRYRGLIPFGHAQEIIANYDVLVLPSRFDGWGVVVNESICAHVPVVCSNQVGAHALVEKFGSGSVVDADDADSLSLALKELVLNPQRLANMRTAAVRAADAIEPAVAAQYMLSVIEAAPGMKANVSSPWYGSGHG